MNAPATAGTTAPTTPGVLFAGGIYAGRFFVGATAYALIVAPKELGELKSKWGKLTNVAGAESFNDGVANTDAMVGAASPLAKTVRALVIDGYADWYLPSRLELLLVWGELKPTPACDFERDWYWSSTQYAGYDEYAWSQGFDYGCQGYDHKSVQLRARAVRRCLIP